MKHYLNLIAEISFEIKIWLIESQDYLRFFGQKSLLKESIIINCIYVKFSYRLIFIYLFFFSCSRRNILYILNSILSFFLFYYPCSEFHSHNHGIIRYFNLFICRIIRSITYIIDCILLHFPFVVIDNPSFHLERTTSYEIYLCYN